MAQLGEETVILTTYKNTLKTKLFDEVFVATDSEIIFDEITQNGGKAIMSKIEHQTGSGRIAEAVGDIDCDIVLNIQGDEPLVNKVALGKLILAYNNDVIVEIYLATLYHKIVDFDEINDR